MMTKYTIVLTENQASQLNDIMVGINASWGYASAPKLKIDIPVPMKESPAYKKGFEDGKKIADKDFEEIQDNTHDVVYMAYYNEALKDANHAIDVLEDMTVAEVKEWFEDCIGIDDVICEFTIQQIVKIIKTYEEEKKAEEIRVGDEVRSCKGDAVMVVTRVNEAKETITGIYDGCEYFNRDIADWEKTGRHFDEIEQLLSKLKER